ncbi:MAG TPA: anti-sigma factor [Stellaceae bacterium]|nr:anti-sigma factor [Stellaceae bacterium]
MIPADRDELNVLAGEYVLGTLEPEARREVEAALAGNAELRRAVAFWEERLHPLSRLAQPAEPPAQAWDGIAARLDPSKPTRAAPGLWQSAALWRWTTAAASLAAACLALYIAIAPPAAAPSFIAMLRAPQQDQPAWIATAGRNGLLLRAVAGETTLVDRSFELWAIAPGAKQPQSLGVIPANGRLDLGALPTAIHSGGTLAISIEPKGGSPTGQPTGPIVFVGTLIATK